jgi:hypothetical protein
MARVALALALVMPMALAFNHPGSGSLLIQRKIPALSSSVARRHPENPVVVMAAGGKNKAAFRGFGSLPDKMRDRTPKSADEQCVCWSVPYCIQKCSAGREPTMSATHGPGLMQRYDGREDACEID